jgi:hypothetical protein
VDLRPINLVHGDTHYNGNGKHRRLLVFGDPRGRDYTVREDNDGLPRATEADRRKALNGWQRLHKRGVRLEYLGASEPYGPFESIDHTYVPKP